jgi:sec-independent protein translocase protein TatC
MTVVQHLEEFRRVLIISMAAWALTTIVAFVFNHQLLDVMLEPLRKVVPGENKLFPAGGPVSIITGPTEGLTIPLKVATAAGFIAALPIILWQLWTFVAPGLRPAERKFAGPFIASALLLFAVGAAFAYFVMPIGLNFLINFLSGTAIYFPDLDTYLSFFLLLIVVFGVTFELPVVIVLLGMLGITSSKWLRARRKAIWIGIVFVALVVTPGADPYTPTALAVPLVILFELSVLVLGKVLHR